MSVYPDAAAHARITGELVHALTEGGKVCCANRFGQRRLEEGYDGEGCFLLSVYGIGSTVGSDLVVVAVERDHLPVKRIERAEAKVAVRLQLREAYVTVVVAVEQGVDGRGLEQGVV